MSFKQCPVRHSTFMIIDIKNYFYGNKKCILSFQEEIFKLLKGVLNVDSIKMKQMELLVQTALNSQFYSGFLIYICYFSFSF